MGGMVGVLVWVKGIEYCCIMLICDKYEVYIIEYIIEYVLDYGYEILRRYV